MRHWRLLKWLAPTWVERHERDARRRELEIEAVKRKQQRASESIAENTRRLEDIEAQVRVLSRGVIKGER